MTEVEDGMAQMRTDLYCLLATLLREPPSAQLLANLRQLAIEAEKTPGSLLEALACLKKSAEQMSSETVEAEFHDLFIGVTRGELLPYGSWYQNGNLHDTPLAELREDLQRLEIEREPGYCESEDHIAAVCETMVLLVSEEDERQKMFFIKHLLPWGESLFNDIERAEKARFYRFVAVLGKEVMRLERQYFGLQPPM